MQRDKLNCCFELTEVINKHSIVTKTDKYGIITYANENFCAISGFREDELIGQSHNIVRHPSNPTIIFKDMWYCISNKQEWVGLLLNKNKFGNEFYTHTIIFPIVSYDNEIVEYVALRNDVTILQEQSMLLQRMAYYDSLTSLGNYIMLNEDLKKMKGKDICLSFIDINDFNEINNVFSYEIGDSILRLVSKRLQKAFNDDKVYRKNGDVFVVLHKGKDIDGFQKYLTASLSEIFCHPFRVDTFETMLDISVGLSGSNNSTTLYRNTEIALQKAKSTKKKLVLFEDSMIVDLDKNFKNTKRISKELKEAILQDRIVPYFQPIFNNKTQKIDKYECLARLVMVDGNIMPPGQFLDIAKKTKNYEEITRIMIKKSFKYFEDKDFNFAINISFTDIMNKVTRNLILSEIEKINNPKRVTFEILEDEDLVEFGTSTVNINSNDVENSNPLNAFFSTLRKQGCNIAIDDFGTGYSNFSRLMQLDADILKIDGSLIKQIAENPIAYLIVTQMNIIAHSMGIKTVAEFVSSEEIQKQTKQIGIDYSQGYFIGMPSKDIILEDV